MDEQMKAGVRLLPWWTFIKPLVILTIRATVAGAVVGVVLTVPLGLIFGVDRRGLWITVVTLTSVFLLVQLWIIQRYLINLDTQAKRQRVPLRLMWEARSIHQLHDRPGFRNWSETTMYQRVCDERLIDALGVPKKLPRDN